jgi:hypothetical protein
LPPFGKEVAEHYGYFPFCEPSMVSDTRLAPDRCFPEICRARAGASVVLSCLISNFDWPILQSKGYTSNSSNQVSNLSGLSF